MNRKIVHTRHVLAVKDLAVSAAYFNEKLGFDRDFTAPGWEFLSFGEFKVMLGECSDALWAHETGDHSWFAHCLVENVDEVYEELKGRSAVILSPIADKPWGIREFCTVTPDGHRISFGQLVRRRSGTYSFRFCLPLFSRQVAVKANMRGYTTLVPSSSAHEAADHCGVVCRMPSG